MVEAVLETHNLTKQFDAITAVNQVNTSFNEDTLHSIIGPNGAGKTTFFNLLTGSIQPTSGQIFFRGEEITDRSPEEIARRKLIRSYQVTNIFNNLTVLENIRISVQSDHNPYNFWGRADKMPGLIEEAEKILERIGLNHKRDTEAGTLSHGEQRTLELGVALGADPVMLLLDEPSSGMSSEETKEIISLIDELSEDLTIVLVEHKMSVVMQVSDQILVLHNGEKIANGSPDEVRNDEEVQRIYLRGGAAE